MVRKIGIGTAAVLAFLAALVIVLMLTPDGFRVALRDIAIIFMVVLGIVHALLMVALVVALIVVVFLLKDKIVPLLEEITATVKRVRGTTEFMTDEVVEPIIQAAGTVAKVKAMARSALGREGGQHQRPSTRPGER